MGFAEKMKFVTNDSFLFDSFIIRNDLINSHSEIFNNKKRVQVGRHGGLLYSNSKDNSTTFSQVAGTLNLKYLFS